MHRLRVPRGPWVPLLLIILFGSVVMSTLSSQFLTTFNIYVVLSNAALLAVIGFAQLTALGVGEFSLAVGGIGSLTSVLVGHVFLKHGFGLAPALLLALAGGVACGLVNGVLVAKSGVDGFIVTLATGGAFAGISVGITQTQPYTNLPTVFTDFGTGRVGFIPYLAGATILAAIALGALYRWRRTGRRMLAVGGNREAAELSGISATRAVIWGHALSGLLAALAGIMATAQFHEANPALGVDWLITSFTVAIIGGTSLNGGIVSIGGVLVAGLIMATINDGLVLVNVNPYWVTLVGGILVFVAVVLGRQGAWNTYYRLVAVRLRGRRLARA